MPSYCMSSITKQNVNTGLMFYEERFYYRHEPILLEKFTSQVGMFKVPFKSSDETGISFGNDPIYTPC